MRLMQTLEQFLYALSKLLYYPVIVGLSALAVYLMLVLGQFAREWFERRRGPSAAVRRFGAALERELSQCRSPDRSAERAVRGARLLQETELMLSASLDKVRFIIKVGPALGLMGTLIPMGVALAALAQGDVPNMAGHMVTAFTATVVGLGCSVFAYVIALIRGKWLSADLCRMEYEAEMRLAAAPVQDEPTRRPTTLGETGDAIDEAA